MNTKIVNKIKKMLSLSQSKNEHEAKLALLKAQELMLRYNISDEKLKEDDETIEK